MGARCMWQGFAVFAQVAGGVCYLCEATAVVACGRWTDALPSKKLRGVLAGAYRQANGQVRGQLLVS